MLNHHKIPTRKQLKSIEKQAERVAAMATTGNPVSVMQLSRLYALARAGLLTGASEEAAVEACRAWIVKVNAGEA